MAFAVIGGLLTSAALSLLAVPVVFSYSTPCGARLPGCPAGPRARYERGTAR